jgi:pimeloyl-ACP methyl ester carboxylesterase
MVKKLLLLLLASSFVAAADAQVSYPYPVKYINVHVERMDVPMAYMDETPATFNGQTVLLFHGKNFNGFYWKDVMSNLLKAGYRVIAPDQIGWGKSAKPNIHYSFFMLAQNNARLLDSLGIKKVNVIGHSMGGMLAIRFAVTYASYVNKLILENPIGLEDYCAFVPYQTTEQLYKKELKSTYESMKNYQRSYYPQWKDEYEPYVAAQAEQLNDPNFAETAWANALTYQMIYEQPVIYHADSIKAPTLLIIGQEDRTVVGKDRLNEQQKKVYGNYPALGTKLQQHIKSSKLVEVQGVGHIPHIQVLPAFMNHVLAFFK